MSDWKVIPVKLQLFHSKLQHFPFETSDFSQMAWFWDVETGSITWTFKIKISKYYLYVTTQAEPCSSL